MKELNEMTPIELNVLINKAKENHDIIKSRIIGLTHEVDEKVIEINKYIENFKIIENKYVELMGVLISKQKIDDVR